MAAELQKRIRSGHWSPDEALPSEARLMAEFSVSRVTVRLALKSLEERRLIYKQQGRGTFVRPLQHGLSKETSTIIEAFRKAGIEPEVKILGLDQMAFPEYIADKVEMQGQNGVRLRRLYSHEGTPIALVSLYVPLSMSGVAYMLADSANSHETIYSILEQRMGVVIKEARHIIKTAALDDTDASALQLSPGNVCLCMERITYSMQSHPIEMMIYTYPPGRMQFEMLLPRDDKKLTARASEHSHDVQGLDF
jgi:GntR family transcriptional regulator